MMSPNTVTAQITPVFYEKGEAQRLNEGTTEFVHCQMLNLFDKASWYKHYHLRLFDSVQICHCSHVFINSVPIIKSL